MIYGTITSATNNTPVLSGTLTWTNSLAAAPSTKAVTQATLVSVNGQSFYILRVPFETRSFGLAAPVVVLTPSPNTLELLPAATTYARSAFYVSSDGQQHSVAALVPPAAARYSFGAADRGKAERVDLTVAVDTSIDAFAAWIAKYPNIPANLRGLNDDPDNDGASNYSEFLAGTDPSSKDSVLRLVPDANARVVSGNFTGIKIIWDSVPGKTYAIQRSTDLRGSFSSVESALTATAPETSVTDSTAIGTGPYFYRILLSP